MNEVQLIESVALRTARRKRWQRAWKGAWFGLFAGAVLWVAALAVYKVFPIPLEAVWWTGAVSCLLVPGGFLVGGWRRPGLMEAARWLDERSRLQQRLSTALEVAGKPDAGNPESGRWRELLLGDASRHAREMDFRRLLPFHLPRISRWGLLALALGAGLGFVPEYRTKAFLQKQKDTQNIQDVGKQLATFTRREIKRRPPALAPTREALDSVQQLGRHLSKATLSRAEALHDLAKVTDKLKEKTSKLTDDPALKRMQQAARSPGASGSQDLAGLQKKMEALQKALGNLHSNSAALEKLRRDLNKLMEAASGLPNESSAAQQAKAQIAKSLANLTQRAENLGASLPSLELAMDALKKSQIDRFMREMQQATTDLDKLAKMAKQMENLQSQSQKLGKDLAEQLERGQAEAAQATLHKMINQLKSSDLSPQALRKIMGEVSKALPPAKYYGKVSEYLKKGDQQMQAGQKQAAAQSLAQAAKELSKLMQQLQDAQSMMASLQALQQAQFCIGNGMCWSKCSGMGMGMGMGFCNSPGASLNGSRPGGGVGTWANENSGWFGPPQFTDRWDNSKVKRPEMTSRSGEQAPARTQNGLIPTRVRGQFSPGEAMPSITLKGLSIKGRSQVDYREQVTAAQSSAQSALSQDKVPRAYQGAVRDYFNDLSK